MREATLAFGNGTYKAGDTISVGTNFSYTVTGLEEDLASAFETAVSSAASPGFNASSSPSRAVTLTASTTGLGGAFANPILSLGTESPSSLSMLINTDISTRNSANNAIEQLDLGLQAVSEGRAELGAVINRLTYASDNLTNVSQNTSESHSRILDTDYAQATTELARTQIISQAAGAMLAQANQAPQSVLSLLR